MRGIGILFVRSWFSNKSRSMIIVIDETGELEEARAHSELLLFLIDLEYFSTNDKVRLKYRTSN